MPSHGLIQSAQEVLVELLFGVLVKLVVLLQQGLLGPHLRQGGLHARRSDSLAFVAATVRRRHRLDLLNNCLPGVNLIDDGEESGQFCLVPWQCFQLVH